jgi:hypothetical protein
MRVSVGARALMIALATGSLIAVPLAGAASAASPASCGVVTTKTVGTKTTITAAKCLPKSATGGGGTATTTTGSGKLAGKLIVTTKWASGHGTTKTAITFAPAKTKGKCPTGSTRIALTGKVVSSTGLAAKVIKAGQLVTASSCAFTSGAKKGQVSLEPGTVEKL